MIALAGLLAVLLVGVVLPRVSGGDSGSAVAADATAAPASTAPTAAPATAPADPVAAEVETLRAFVEKERGLTFKTPVQVTMLEPAAFLERALEDEEVDEEAIRRAEMILKAFGLLTPDVDLLELSRNVVDNGLLGFFDPETKELYVRGTAVTPLLRTVIVHELTHALDDQHFDLARINVDQPAEDGSDDEFTLAFRALVEGSAVRVEKAYRTTMSASDQAAADAEEQALLDGLGGDETVPYQPVSYYLAFPYAQGHEFVRALLEAGGQKALDRSFAAPPRTTAEILEFERFQRGLRGATINYPEADGMVVEKGVLGELSLLMILLETMGPDAAAVGAVGWEGDRFVAWRDGDRMCVRSRFLLESPWTTVATAEALAHWAERQIDAKVESPGTVLLTSCR